MLKITSARRNRPLRGAIMTWVESLETRTLLSTAAPAPRLIGYFPDYRYSTINKIDFSLLTHVNYFAILPAGSTGGLDTSQISLSNLDNTVSLVHGLGETISITVGAGDLDPIASSSNLNTFATTLVNFCQTHHLDGIDFDWEPSPTESANPNEPADYGTLVNAVYAKSHPAGLTLSAAVNPVDDDLSGVDIGKLDWVEDMAYDFGLGANNSTLADSKTSMQTWNTSYGVPASKLVMGTPFYGRNNTSWNDYGVYGDLMNDYYTAHGAYPPITLDNYEGYYFNNVPTVEQKAAFVRDNGYGGMAIWDLGQDHWNTSNQYDRNSLLPAIASTLRPPGWITASSGATLDLVGSTLYADAGTITLNTDGGAAVPGLNLNIADANGGVMTKVILNASQQLGSITFGPSGTGVLDMKSNVIVINYTGASPIGTWNGSTYTGILGMVKTGRNTGQWNGSEIASSSVGATGEYAIGVAEASAVMGFTGGNQTVIWNGETVDGSSVLVKYTYAGDANLDGKVNGDDYFAIDSHVNQNGSVFGWNNGDFNYDGKINGDDYFVIDSNINKQGAPLKSPTPTLPLPTAMPGTTLSPFATPATTLFLTQPTPLAAPLFAQAEKTSLFD